MTVFNYHPIIYCAFTQTIGSTSSGGASGSGAFGSSIGARPRQQYPYLERLHQLPGQHLIHSSTKSITQWVSWAGPAGVLAQGRRLNSIPLSSGIIPATQWLFTIWSGVIASITGGGICAIFEHSFHPYNQGHHFHMTWAHTAHTMRASSYGQAHTAHTVGGIISIWPGCTAHTVGRHHLHMAWAHTAHTVRRHHSMDVHTAHTIRWHHFHMAGLIPPCVEASFPYDLGSYCPYNHVASFPYDLVIPPIQSCGIISI